MLEEREGEARGGRVEPATLWEVEGKEEKEEKELRAEPDGEAVLGEGIVVVVLEDWRCDMEGRTGAEGMTCCAEARVSSTGSEQPQWRKETYVGREDPRASI